MGWRKQHRAHVGAGEKDNVLKCKGSVWFSASRRWEPKKCVRARPGKSWG